MEQACKEMGMSMTTAFTVFAVKAGNEKRIPFEITADPFYSESNMRYLRRVIADIEAGKATLAEHEPIEDQTMKLPWEERAWEGYCYWQAQDRKTLRKINSLIRDIQRGAQKNLLYFAYPINRSLPDREKTHKYQVYFG